MDNRFLIDTTSAFTITRFAANQHYLTMRNWWIDRGLEAPTLDRLSAIGFIVSDHEPLVMGWLFYGDAKTGAIAYVVSNPTAYARRKLLALMYFLNTAVSILKSSGVKYAYCYSGNRGLTRILEILGFVRLADQSLLTKILS